MRSENNIFNNDNLDVGVIFKEEFKGNTIKCKLFMNDDNLKMDNGILSIYCLMDNDRMAENIHLSLNDNFNGEYWVKVYLNDEYICEKRLCYVDCDDMWEAFK